MHQPTVWAGLRNLISLHFSPWLRPPLWCLPPSPCPWMSWALAQQGQCPKPTRVGTPTHTGEFSATSESRAWSVIQDRPQTVTRFRSAEPERDAPSTHWTRGPLAQCCLVGAVKESGAPRPTTLCAKLHSKPQPSIQRPCDWTPQLGHPCPL